MAEREYPCPECGRILIEGFSTDPMTGRDEHHFQCAGHDCFSLFDADEIIPEPTDQLYAPSPPAGSNPVSSGVDDLVARLRNWQKYGGWVEHEHVTYGAGTGNEYRTKQRTPTIVYQPEPLMREAADAIESTQASLKDQADATEQRFWRIVDQNGLSGLPSDMWDALDRLVCRDAAAQARIAELEAERDRARGALDVAWQEAHKMRNASKLVGPYPNDPAANRLWARSLYHAGKDLATKLKSFRALKEPRHD